MRCLSCKSDVTPIPPRSAWKLVSLAAWVASMAVATVFGLLMGLNIVLAPVAIAIGMSIGVSARRAGSWTCPKCREMLFEPLGALPRVKKVERTRPARPLAPALAG